MTFIKWFSKPFSSPPPSLMCQNLEFILDNASHKRTSAATHLKLSKDESGVDVDQILYISMIGSLLYLTSSRLAIIFFVGVCARYQA